MCVLHIKRYYDPGICENQKTVAKASDVTRNGVGKNVSKNQFRHVWNLWLEVGLKFRNV